LLILLLVDYKQLHKVWETLNLIDFNHTFWFKKIASDTFGSV